MLASSIADGNYCTVVRILNEKFNLEHNYEVRECDGTSNSSRSAICNAHVYALLCQLHL